MAPCCKCNDTPIRIGAVEALFSTDNLEQKTETYAHCDHSIDITWSPCQVAGWGRSPDQSIFYMKSLPYVSWYESKNNNLIANTYNTLAKTISPYISSGFFIFRSDYNATIGDPIPVHYTSTQDTTNRNFNRRFSYPSGYDYFQSEIYAITEGNTYPFLIEDWLTTPSETVVLGSPYSDFSSSDGFNPYTQQWPSIPYWLRNYWLPSWTPKYPVIASRDFCYSGNKIRRIDNVYNDKMPYDCNTCQYDGTTGCCKTNGVCEEDVPKTQCCLSGGVWSPGTCSTLCPSCNQINPDPITVNFNSSAQSKDVQIHSLSPLCQWNAEENTDWFIIDPPQGTSNLIRVTVQDNSNGPFRQDDIILTQDSITKIITIAQTGTDENPTGACCLGTNCDIKTLLACQSAGGVFQGQGTGCSPNPCNYIGACCLGTNCNMKTLLVCQSAGGVFQGQGTNCSPNPCDDGGGGGGIAKDCCDYFIGPCCLWPSGCTYFTPQKCKDVDGIFLGFNQTRDNCPS